MARVHVVQCFLLRKTLRAGTEPQGRSRDLHQIGRVALIHDAEVTWQAGSRSEASQQPMSGRVECPAVHVPAGAPDEPLGARQHLVSGASGERQEENPLRPHTAIHEVGHAIHKRARLAAPGARDDQQRAVPMRRRRELVRVKLRREIATAGSRRHDALMERNNSAAIVRHTRNIPEGAGRSHAGSVTADIAFPPTPDHAPH